MKTLLGLSPGRTFKILALGLCCQVLSGNAAGQIIWSSASGSTWLTGSNWTGGSFPSTTQVAQFNVNPTSGVTGVGVDLGSGSTNNGTNNQAAGAIYASSSRTAALIVGNSSTVSNGILTLNGATVNGTANVVIANFGINGATRQTMTLQNIQGTGTKTMEVNLASGTNITTGTGASSTLAGNTINITSVIRGSGPTFLGGGTWDGSTGVLGGLLKFGAANTFSGGVTVGSPSSTYSSGILQLDIKTAINNVSGNNITINPFSELFLNSTSTDSFQTGNLTLNLNGLGNNATNTTTGGALINGVNKSFTWTGPINLASDAKISVVGTATMSLPGSISGSGALIKTGSTSGGVLSLLGGNNTWSGGTQIIAGSIIVGASSSLGSGGGITMAGATTGVNTTITLNHPAQTITSLSSSFGTATGTIAQTLSLASGHRLTLNISSDCIFGAGAVNTLNSLISGAGKVIKNGSGTLALTGKGSFITGGLRINAGQIKITPSGGLTMTAPDTLNGGSISTVGDTATTGANATITLGTLNLSDNSNIYLGTTVAHVLKFGASSAITWTAGKMLTVNGWSGSWGAGTSGNLGRFQVGTTSGGLIASQLAQIQFVDGSGNYYPAQILSSGEVVPKFPTITTTPASFGPFYNTIANPISVAFTTSVGTFYGRFKVQMSDSSGAFTADTVTGILDSGLTSPISANIPAGTLYGNYRVRVISGSPNITFGSDNGSDIAVLVYPPTVTAVSPYSAKPGDTIALTGTNFSGAPSANIVYFGATKGTVVSGSTTSLNVIVPSGATLSPLSVNTPAALFGYSKYSFMPTFRSSYFITSSFNVKPKVDFSTGTGPNGAAIGDLDGDGKSDIVVPNSNAGAGTTLTLYLNTSTTGTINASSFTSAGTLTTGTGPSNVSLSDMDGDGKLDIMVTSLASASVSVFRNISSTGSLSFAARANVSTISSGVIGAQPFEVAVADFDGDGKPDMATTSPYTGASNSTISIMRNISTVGTLTSGSFATAVSFNTPGSLGSNCSPIGIVAADFDGDGKPDFAVACSSAASVAVYRNTATAGVINSGSFASRQVFSTGSIGANPIDVVAGDIDGDGKPDLVLSNSGSANIAVLRNTSTSGSISFASVVQFASGTAPTGLALADINGDGKLDVAAANAGSNTVSLYRNTATSGSITSGSLATKVDYSVGTTPYGVNIGDLDNDGYPDIVSGNNGDNTISIIRDYPLPFVAAITGTTTACGGGGTTTLSNATTGGIWSVTNTVKATINSSTGVVTGLTSGTDTVIYTVVAGGDTNTTQTPITIDAAPTVAAISGPSSVCISGNITLTDATPSGTWGMTNSNATINSSGVVTGVTSGLDTATYLVVNGSGCSTTVTKPITITPPATAGTIAGSSTVCVSGTAGLSDTTAGGTWTSSNTSRATVNASTGLVYGVSTGSVTITYTVVGTCNTAFTTYGMTVITTLPTPAPITGTTSLCTGASTTLSDTSAGGIWSTTDPAVASINPSSGYIIAVSAGTVNVTYSRTNSCGTTFITTPFNSYASLAGSIVSTTPPCANHATTIVFNGTSGARMTYQVDGGTPVDTVLTGGTFSLNTGNINTPHTYTFHTIYNAGCSLTIDTSVVVTPIPMQWVGGYSGSETNWNIAANWSCGFVPGTGDDVAIPYGTTYSPILPASVTLSVRNLAIANGAVVTLYSGSILNVSGNFSNGGTVNGTGTIRLNGSSAQSVSGIGTIGNLELSNAAGAGIAASSRVTVTNTLTLSGGAFTTGDSLVLYADSLATARIAPITGGGSISGYVKAMQYIQGGYRRYRFWSHPFSSNVNLSQIGQYIDITGRGGSANGFTTTASNAPSAFWYNPLKANSSLGYDTGWRAFTDAYGTADSNRIHKHQGIRIFIRGAKGEGLGYGAYTPSPVTIAMTGNVNQGNQTVVLLKGSSANQDYNMVGNPYHSPVDIGTVVYNASVAGNITGSAFYVFNPTLGSGGQFQSITIANSPYYLQSECAFQVRAAHNGDTLHFTESNKAVSATSILLRATPYATSFTIYDANYHPWDMLSVQFNDEATAAEDARYDALKLAGGGLNFYSLAEDGKKLSIDARPFADHATIPLGINSTYAQDYIIKVDNVVLPSGGTLFLHDKLKNVYTAVQHGAEYRFAITKEEATQGENRFELTAGQSASTPSKLMVNMQPNPATDDVTISIAGPGSADATIIITNVTRQQVYYCKLPASEPAVKKVSLQNFAAGIYMVEVSCGNEKTVQRLIKE